MEARDNLESTPKSSPSSPNQLTSIHQQHHHQHLRPAERSPLKGHPTSCLPIPRSVFIPHRHISHSPSISAPALSQAPGPTFRRHASLLKKHHRPNLRYVGRLRRCHNSTRQQDCLLRTCRPSNRRADKETSTSPFPPTISIPSDPLLRSPTTTTPSPKTTTSVPPTP